MLTNMVTNVKYIHSISKIDINVHTTRKNTFTYNDL